MIIQNKQYSIYQSVDGVCSKWNYLEYSYRNNHNSISISKITIITKLSSKIPTAPPIINDFIHNESY